MTTRQTAKSVPLVEQVHNAMKEPVGVRAAALRNVIEGINAEIATCQQRGEAQRADTDRALLESAEAYAKNQIGIQETADAEAHLSALLKVAHRELKKAEFAAEEHDLRADGAAMLKMVRAAAKMSREYERLAGEIAQILTAQRGAIEAYMDLRSRLRQMEQHPDRGGAWRQEVEREFYDPAPLKAMELTGGAGVLFELVQLPSVSNASPIWGDVFGGIESSDVPASPAPEETTRTVGVYDASGRKLPSYRSLPQPR